MMVLHLSENGYPVPKPIPLHGKESHEFNDFLLVYQSWYLIVEEFIVGIELERDTRLFPYRKYYSKVEKYYETIGKFSAKLHDILMGYNPSFVHRFKDRLQIIEELKDETFSNVLNQVLAKSDDQRNVCEKYYADNYEDFVSNIFRQKELFIKNWDKSNNISIHIHNDLHFGNVFFSEDGENIVGLIDFQYAQCDSRVVEFNNMLMATLQPGGNNIECLIYKTDDLIKFFKILLNSYQKHSQNPMNSYEIQNAWEVIRHRIIESIYTRDFNEKIEQRFLLRDPNKFILLQSRLTLLKTFPNIYQDHQ